MREERSQKGGTFAAGSMCRQCKCVRQCVCVVGQQREEWVGNLGAFLAASGDTIIDSTDCIGANIMCNKGSILGRPLRAVEASGAA